MTIAMKLTKGLLVAAFSWSLCQAALDDVETLYRSILSEQDQTKIPKPTDLIGRIRWSSVLRDASPQEIEAVLPLAERCLESSSRVLQTDGMFLMSGIATIRPDNAVLLAPYFGEIASFLTDPDVGQKQSAIGVLASGFPKPAPKALAYLAAHLGDPQNDGTQFMMISGALLVASPSDRATVSAVLAAMKRRPDSEALTGPMIEALGQQKVATEESIEFLRAGLRDKSAAVRLTALEAVGQMPGDVRLSFSGDIQRLLTNPDEQPQVLEAARRLLTQ